MTWTSLYIILKKKIIILVNMVGSQDPFLDIDIDELGDLVILESANPDPAGGDMSTLHDVNPLSTAGMPEPILTDLEFTRLLGNDNRTLPPPGNQSVGALSSAPLPGNLLAYSQLTLWRKVLKYSFCM